MVAVDRGHSRARDHRIARPPHRRVRRVVHLLLDLRKNIYFSQNNERCPANLSFSSSP